MKITSSKIIYTVIIITLLTGFISSSVALLLGFLFNVFLKNPFKKYEHKSISILLKVSVVGLGFGMFINETIKTGKEGFGLTVSTILITVFLGVFLSKLFKIDHKLGHLITSGTAICGGSAIAAIAPTIRAKGKVISVALGIVFLLNSIALFIFPPLGHFLELTQKQFGLWCAVAIHDTSSVVGAALEYGDEALRIATTVKLSRTLWIIPLAIFSMFFFKTKGEKIKIPYFILLFILAIIINSFHLLPEFFTQFIVVLAKRLLIVTLFLIGMSISIRDIKSIGIKPILLAILLWGFISIFSLLYIL